MNKKHSRKTNTPVGIKKSASSFCDVIFGKKKIKRLGATEEEIMLELSFSDLLISFLCSAGSVRLMNRTMRELSYDRYKRKCALARLQRAGYVNQVDADNSEMVTLTLLGRMMMRKNDKDSTTTSQREWDGLWYIVSFDVPEQNRRIRQALRSLLVRNNFMHVQGSVYISPYPCEELIEFLIADRRLKQYIFFVVAKIITNEDVWKKKFSIKIVE